MDSPDRDPALQESFDNSKLSPAAFASITKIGEKQSTNVASAMMDFDGETLGWKVFARFFTNQIR